ncbi:hypothetical protein P7C70_g3408, partial [Phenoliferia sp. Uapishka_3]
MLVEQDGRSTLQSTPQLEPTFDPQLDDDDKRLLSQSQLDAIQTCLKSGSLLSHDDDTTRYVSSLSAALSQHHSSREREQAERHSFELAQLQSQARALACKIVDNARPQTSAPSRSAAHHGRHLSNNSNGSPPPDYHQLSGSNGFGDGAFVPESESEMENRKLRADVRQLKARLRDSEGQTSRLESQLRKLRPHLLTAAPLIATDALIQLPPSPPNIPSTQSDPLPARIRPPLMGDAESELLLAAGKSLSHIRRINRIPLTEAILNQAHEIINAGPSLATIVPGPSTTNANIDEATPRQLNKPKPKKSGPAYASVAYVVTQSPPHSPSKTPRGAPTTPRRAAGLARPHTPSYSTPSGGGGGAFGGMSDLLQAAQTVLVPVEESTGDGNGDQEAVATQGSSKRRRLSTTANDGAAKWVPASGEGLRQVSVGGREGGDEEAERPEAFSALDLLAQASSSQEGGAPSASSTQAPKLRGVNVLGPSFQQSPKLPIGGATEERFEQNPAMMKNVRSPYQRPLHSLVTASRALDVGCGVIGCAHGSSLLSFFTRVVPHESAPLEPSFKQVQSPVMDTDSSLLSPADASAEPTPLPSPSLTELASPPPLTPDAHSASARPTWPDPAAVKLTTTYSPPPKPPAAAPLHGEDGLRRKVSASSARSGGLVGRFEINLADHLAEHLSGLNGQTLKSICEASGVKGELIGNQGAKKLVGWGSSSAVTKAKQLIDARLSQTPIRILLAIRLQSESSTLRLRRSPAATNVISPLSDATTFNIVESAPLTPHNPVEQSFYPPISPMTINTPASEKSSESSFFSAYSGGGGTPGSGTPLRPTSAIGDITSTGLPSVGSWVPNKEAYIEAIVKELEGCVARSSLVKLKFFAGSQLFQLTGSLAGADGLKVTMEGIIILFPVFKLLPLTFICSRRLTLEGWLPFPTRAPRPSSPFPVHRLTVPTQPLPKLFRVPLPTDRRKLQTSTRKNGSRTLTRNLSGPHHPP